MKAAGATVAERQESMVSYVISVCDRVVQVAFMHLLGKDFYLHYRLGKHKHTYL